MASTNNFSSVNIGYVLELYERYQQNPDSVDAETRAFFQQWTPPSEDGASAVAERRENAPTLVTVDKIVGAANLANAASDVGSTPHSSAGTQLVSCGRKTSVSLAQGHIRDV